MEESCFSVSQISQQVAPEAFYSPVMKAYYLSRPVDIGDMRGVWTALGDTSVMSIKKQAHLCYLSRYKVEWSVPFASSRGCRSGQVRYGAVHRSSASPLLPYDSSGFRLEIAQADAWPVMPVMPVFYR